MRSPCSAISPAFSLEQQSENQKQQRLVLGQGEAGGPRPLKGNDAQNLITPDPPARDCQIFLHELEVGHDETIRGSMVLDASHKEALREESVQGDAKPVPLGVGQSAELIHWDTFSQIGAPEI